MVSKKNIIILLLLFLFISYASFLFGIMAHRYGLYGRIPGTTRIMDFAKRRLLEEKPKEPVFYEAPNQGPSEIFRQSEVEYPFTYIVYGDTRECASDEKDALIDKIIEEKPAFVIHLGDMVHYADEHNWRIFDFFEGRIIESGIPFYPVLGNHEYWTRDTGYPEDPEPQLRHYFKRFPFLGGKRWYSFTFGNSLFLMLDTDTDYSSGSYQYKWLIRSLKTESPTFTFVSFHRPPYTKGKYHGPRESEKLLAEIFEGYGERSLLKADILFSGHAHSYERYRHRDINYVVSGGGGAPQYPVKRDRGDFYGKEGEAFHYCKITVSENEALFEMVRFGGTTGEWKTDDTFRISK